MIRQSLTFDDILEKKFKILRTSIMLGNLKNRDEILREFEDTAREVDKIKKNVYEELLASKMYTTVTLEEEESRLKELITFIENRVKERNDFVDDYIKITSNFLDGLEKVSLENELDNYKNRYKNIDEYLNNCKKINELNDKLKNLRDELEEKYENKANNELINSKLEDELIEEFNNIISRNEYYSSLDYTDIDYELTKLDESILDKNSVMDTFMSSYQALVSAGISGAEREEYASYVQEARMNYYEDIEKKCVLNIYKLILDKQVNYESLYDKRIAIEKILDERNKVRSSLDINNRDMLDYFISLCREQLSIIKSQKFNMENIDKLILEIADCENQLELLEKDNNREEIIDLLSEYSVDSVEIEKIELPEEEKVYEEVIENNNIKKPSNMVVKIKDPIKINVKTASDTAKLVMKKVVIVLEPKKFGDQRDKLREAELELEREKKELENRKRIEEENKLEVVNDVKIEDEDTNNIINENIDVVSNDVIDDVVVFDNTDVVDNNLSVVDEKKDDGINTFENSNDIFLDDDMFEIDTSGVNIDTNGIGIELDTKEVFGDNKVKETKELTEIKINASNPSSMSIPTEIYIEDPPVEKEIELFKETDPFLDDNEFELEDNKYIDEVNANMPFLGNIGTVKPNNALSKIESVVKDSNDVILPNLGLVDDVKSDVPIVSENYIN